MSLRRKKPSRRAPAKGGGGRRKSTAYGSSSQEQASHELRAIFNEAEKAQLAAWLHKKNKELESQLARLGVGGNKRGGGANSILLPNEDVLRIMGHRFNHKQDNGPQTLHIHYMEESDDGYQEEGFRSSLSYGDNEEDDMSRRRKSPGGSSLPMTAKLIEAVAQHGYSPRQVMSLFFPLGLQDRGNAAIMPLEQVMDILAVDLGIALTRSDEIEIVRSYSAANDGSLAIDVHRLLDSVALWYNEDGPLMSRKEEDELLRRHRLFQLQQRKASSAAAANLSSARLEIMRHQAATQIQRLVRGRLGRSRASTFRYYKISSRAAKASGSSSLAARRRLSPSKQAAASNKGRKASAKVAEEDRLFEATSKTKTCGAISRISRKKKHRPMAEEGDEVEESMEGEEADIEFEGWLARFNEELEDQHHGEKASPVTISMPLVELVEGVPSLSPIASAASPPRSTSMHPRPIESLDAQTLLDTGTDDWKLLVPYASNFMSALAQGGRKAFIEFANALNQMSMGGSTGSPAFFLPYISIKSALKTSGFDFQDKDLDQFLLGVGTDKAGQIDVKEMVQALADMLEEAIGPNMSAVERHHHRPTTTRVEGPSSPTPGSFHRGTMWVDSSSPRISPSEMERALSKSGREGAGQANRVLCPAEKAMLKQLKSAKIELTGEVLLKPFHKKDAFDDGFLCVEDFCNVVVDDLGVELDLEDVLELAFKYHCPLEVVEESDGVCVDYAPLIRNLLEAAGKLDHGRGASYNDKEDEDEDEDEEEGEHGDDDSFDDFSWRNASSKAKHRHTSVHSDGLPEVEYGTESSHKDIIITLKNAFYDQPDKCKWLINLRAGFAKADPCGNGTVDGKTLIKVLRGANFHMTEQELSDLASFLSGRNEDGQLAYPKLLRIFDGVLDCPNEEAHELMLAMLHAVGGTTSMRLRWVRRLRKRLSEQDKYRTGILEVHDVLKAIHEADGASGLRRGEELKLIEAFDTMELDGVAYRPMLRSLSRYAGRWFETEPSLAIDVLAEFPGSSPSPRFITALRRMLHDLDTLHEGRLDAEDVEYALHRAGLALDKPHMRALLEALDLDGSGRAYCEDLVGFFEAYQLPWYEVLDDIAIKIRRKVFDDSHQAEQQHHQESPAAGHNRAGWKRFAILRNKLYTYDRFKNGEVDLKKFKEVLEKMDLGLKAHDVDHLVAALEVVGGGSKGAASSTCLYRDLLRYLLEYGGGDIFDELRGDFQHVIKKQLSDQDGGLRVGMERVLNACAQEDRDKAGRISIDDFRHALQRAGAKVALEDVGRLADYSDYYGDGRVAYRTLLLQDGASTPRGPRLHHHGRRKRSRGRSSARYKEGALGSRRKTRDWAWARSRAVLDARASLAKLDGKKKGKVKEVVEQAFRDFDEEGEGTVRPEDLPDIFLMFGADTAEPTDYAELARDLYDVSDGNGGGPGGGRKCIPYEQLIQVLLLSNAEFKSRFPGPLINEVGEREKHVLYEKLAERKRIRVVAHKMPKEGKGCPSSLANGMANPTQQAFIVACEKVDWKKTGFISPQSIKTIFSHLGLDLRVKELRTLTEKFTVGTGRVAYFKLAAHQFGGGQEDEDSDDELGHRGRGAKKTEVRGTTFGKDAKDRRRPPHAF